MTASIRTKRPAAIAIIAFALLAISLYVLFRLPGGGVSSTGNGDERVASSEKDGPPSGEKPIPVSLREPPERWPWETDPEFARAREKAIEKLDEHGWVDFTTDKSIWWNYGEYPSRPLPKQMNVSGVDRFVRFARFAAQTLQGWPEEDGGVRIPPGVEEIVSVPTDVDDRLLAEHLPYLPECRRLVLHLTSVTDEGLAIIEQVPYLRDLFLCYEWTHRYPVLITDRGMAAVGEHPELRLVVLSGMRITDKGIADISLSKTIRRLEIECCPITADSFLSIAKMPRIEKLDFGFDERKVVPKSMSPDFSRPISAEVAEAVASLDGRLKSLKFEGLDVHPSLLSAIARIKSIEKYKGPPLKK